MSETTPNSMLAEAITLFREKKDAPQARFGVRFNQTQTAEAMSMLKKLGLNALADAEGVVPVIDASTLFLALLHTATKSLPVAPADDVRADEFVSGILFPAPVKGDEAPGALTRTPGKKRSKTRR